MIYEIQKQAWSSHKLCYQKKCNLKTTPKMYSRELQQNANFREKRKTTSKIRVSNLFIGIVLWPKSVKQITGHNKID